jgi:hypothetical protein
MKGRGMSVKKTIQEAWKEYVTTGELGGENIKAMAAKIPDGEILRQQFGKPPMNIKMNVTTPNAETFRQSQEKILQDAYAAMAEHRENQQAQITPVENVEPRVYGIWCGEAKLWLENMDGRIYHSVYPQVMQAMIVQNGNSDWVVAEIGMDGKPIFLEFK